MSPEVPQPGEIHTAEEISPRSTYERPALVRLDLRCTELRVAAADNDYTTLGS